MTANLNESEEAIEEIQARSFYEGAMAMQLRAIIAIEALKLCCQSESQKIAYSEAAQRLRELSSDTSHYNSLFTAKISQTINS